MWVCLNEIVHGFHLSLPLPQKEGEHGQDMPPSCDLILQVLLITHLPMVMPHPPQSSLSILNEEDDAALVAFQKLHPLMVLVVCDVCIQRWMVRVQEIHDLLDRQTS